MAFGWLCRKRRLRARSPRFVALALAAWLPIVTTILGWSSAGGQVSVPAGRYTIALAPLSLGAPLPGSLAHPINFGYRCTLVDAAAVLDYYGARSTQAALAVQLSTAVEYSGPGHGPPWWAYVALPGRRPLLDTAIESVARQAGIGVTSETMIGISFARAVAAIAQNHPVILNVVRTPDGTYNHSLLAYGYDTRAGRTLLLVLDPNTQISYWVGRDTYWSETLTSTFITPPPAHAWPEVPPMRQMEEIHVTYANSREHIAGGALATSSIHRLVRKR
jgi:Peptidase_C39 like family